MNGTTKWMGGLAVLAVLCTVAQAQQTAAPYGQVRLKGPIGERMDRMIRHHVMATDVDYITAPFKEKTERRRWWQRGRI